MACSLEDRLKEAETLCQELRMRNQLLESQASFLPPRARTRTHALSHRRVPDYYVHVAAQVAEMVPLRAQNSDLKKKHSGCASELAYLKTALADMKAERDAVLKEAQDQELALKLMRDERNRVLAEHGSCEVLTRLYHRDGVPQLIARSTSNLGIRLSGNHFRSQEEDGIPAGKP